MRLVLASLLALVAVVSAAVPSGLDLLSASAEEVGAYLSNGSVTSVDLVEAYLANIERNNHDGLLLRAVIEPAPRESVLKIAQNLDDERANGTMRSPLHGIPILIKDNCASDPELGMNTTAGSYALLGAPVPRDAHIVKKMRDAGMIILGKANLSEFANYKGNITNGWSARGNQTQSAYVVGGFAAGGDPCGSSAGSGVGVSAGFSPIAIGTETDGSIVCPSNRAALFGLKPTVGLASRAGIVPLSHTQDSPGPMAKSAYDVAALLSIMVGYDERDNATAAIPQNASFDYISALNSSFHGLTIGVPRTVFYNASITGLEDVVYNKTEEVLSQMSSLGANLQDPADLPSAEALVRSGNESIVLAYDFKQDLAQYLSELENATVTTLEDVINFNDAHAAIEMPEGECCQEILITSVQTTGYDSLTYQQALAADKWLGDTNGLGAAFDAYGLDAIAIPAEGFATTPAAIVGWPIATVPIGYYGSDSDKPGQPYGLAFIARPYHEHTLIKIMSAFEANFPKRQVPRQMM